MRMRGYRTVPEPVVADIRILAEAAGLQDSVEKRVRDVALVQPGLRRAEIVGLAGVYHVVPARPAAGVKRG